MADHGTVEYATATGNDYEAHESSYESFVHFTLVGILYVVTILFGLAVGGVMGHWFTAGLLFALGFLSAVHMCLVLALHRRLAALRKWTPGGRPQMRIAVPREIDAGEPRVAATP